MLTDKQYVRRKGLYCPYCESNNIKITSKLKLTETNYCQQELECITCKNEWYEIYELVGYEKISEEIK